MVEMVGIVGVIASLIFVAFQIRQNTRAIESSTIESILSHSYDAVVLTVENADLRAAQVAACNGALTDDQREQLIAYYRALLRLAGLIAAHPRSLGGSMEAISDY